MQCRTGIFQDFEELCFLAEKIMGQKLSFLLQGNIIVFCWCSLFTERVFLMDLNLSLTCVLLTVAI